ncbi:MAG: type I glutamate--ammonia ligase [Lachnospiraceae bacterium]|jgi:glutamine synthetase|nr:type I glutamate--ammonia ligase [Lachnospiraceae bacterium]
MKTVQDVLAYCKENNARMIDFKMIDLNGRWRHLSIPVERFNEDTMKYGIGFDGSSYGFAPVESSDMVFIPNIETANMDPFMEIPTVTMMGDVCIIDQPNNRPFDQYPRNVAKAAIDYMKSEGIADEMLIAPEFEFYIFDHAAFECKSNRVGYSIDTDESAEWNSGIDDEQNLAYRTPKQGGYHLDLPQDITYNLRSRMCMLMQDWGIDVKYQHHEVGGPGQVEIEVELADMLAMADNTMITKYIIKNAAIEDGRTATLLPKPIAGEAGSGMHVHMLLKKDGKPLFYDKDGYSLLSQTAIYFIGGLLKHARSICAFSNPSTNSYKRLIPGFEAPVTIGYATANRSSVVRIPAYAKDPEHKRFELRNGDATANPYYMYAAILMAGIDGIKNKIDPEKNGWGPYDFNLFDLSEEEQKKIESLPTTLEEALDALKEDHDYLTAGGVFPEKLLEIWDDMKRKEAREINNTPHPAEFVKYYDL